jgi:hypothetical protein
MTSLPIPSPGMDAILYVFIYLLLPTVFIWPISAISSKAIMQSLEP